MSTRKIACFSLFLLACSGGGGFIPRKDGGTNGGDGGAQHDMAMKMMGDGGVMCSTMNEPCGTGCCQGLSCTNGTCQQGTCKSSGTSCTQGDTCCEGTVCNSIDAICEACGQNGKLCELQTDCCNGLSCMNGSCQVPQTCSTQGQACGIGCCQGLICNSFTQSCSTCGTANAQCGQDADCCSQQGYVCTNNSCQMPMACAGNGQACTTSADCCNKLYCQNNSCTAAPTCTVIGGTCTANNIDPNGYMVCCESASMDCPSGKCCIEHMYQMVANIKCHQSSDCCNNEVCDVNTGMCN
jgi:hypothetical protein